MGNKDKMAGECAGFLVVKMMLARGVFFGSQNTIFRRKKLLDLWEVGGVPPRAIRLNEPSRRRLSHAGEVLDKWEVVFLIIQNPP